MTSTHQSGAPRGRGTEASVDPGAMREHSAEASELLKTLANEKRLVICCLLMERDHTVAELNARVDLSQSALSQHLAILREAGVVGCERDGQRVRYALTAGPALGVIGALHASYCGPSSTGSPVLPRAAE